MTESLDLKPKKGRPRKVEAAEALVVDKSTEPHTPEDVVITSEKKTRKPRKKAPTVEEIAKPKKERSPRIKAASKEPSPAPFETITEPNFVEPAQEIFPTLEDNEASGLSFIKEIAEKEPQSFEEITQEIQKLESSDFIKEVPSYSNEEEVASQEETSPVAHKYAPIDLFEEDYTAEAHAPAEAPNIPPIPNYPTPPKKGFFGKLKDNFLDLFIQKEDLEEDT